MGVRRDEECCEALSIRSLSPASIIRRAVPSEVRRQLSKPARVHVRLYTQRPKCLRQLVGYALACPRRRAAERRAPSFARVAAKLTKACRTSDEALRRQLPASCIVPAATPASWHPARRLNAVTAAIASQQNWTLSEATGLEAYRTCCPLRLSAGPALLRFVESFRSPHGFTSPPVPAAMPAGWQPARRLNAVTAATRSEARCQGAHRTC
jgi:hypothetical protein